MDRLLNLARSKRELEAQRFRFKTRQTQQNENPDMILRYKESAKEETDKNHEPESTLMSRKHADSFLLEM